MTMGMYVRAPDGRAAMAIDSRGTFGYCYADNAVKMFTFGERLHFAISGPGNLLRTLLHTEIQALLAENPNAPIFEMLCAANLAIARQMKSLSEDPYAILAFWDEGGCRLEGGGGVCEILPRSNLGGFATDAIGDGASGDTALAALVLAYPNAEPAVLAIQAMRGAAAVNVYVAPPFCVVSNYGDNAGSHTIIKS